MSRCWINFRLSGKLAISIRTSVPVSLTYPSPSSAISRSAQMGSAIPIVISFASTSKPRIAVLNRGEADVSDSIDMFSLFTLRFLVVQHMWQWLGNEIDWENHFPIGPSRDRKGRDVWMEEIGERRSSYLTSVRRSSGRSRLYIDSRCVRRFSKRKKSSFDSKRKKLGRPWSDLHCPRRSWSGDGRLPWLLLL